MAFLMANFECRKPHVIACDLDDTLVATAGHDGLAQAANDLALLQIGNLVMDLRGQGKTVHFGSATGRTIDSVQQLATQRPAFGYVAGLMDFHIASVGAAIYTSAGQGQGFADLARITGWPVAPDWRRDALADCLTRFPGLIMQPPGAQDIYKISYEADGDVPAASQAAQLRAHLGAAGLAANVIVSGGGAWRFVDVLPPGVDKGQALLRLPHILPGIAGSEPSTKAICRIAAGDSLNDEATLAAADVAILPANAHEDLLAWAAKNNETPNILFVADERFAAGVLQGLHHHFGANDYA